MIWIKRIGLILLMIFFGTIIDFCIHQLSELFSVPFSYFTHKIIFGTLWAFVTYLAFYFFGKKLIHAPFWLVFAMSAVTSVLLQTFYFINEHELGSVVIFFLFVHLLCFLIPGYHIVNKYGNLFIL